MTVELTVDAISKSFLHRRVIRDVSVSVPSGTCLGVIGDNGSGKSTFVRIVAGVLRADRGHVTLRVDGRDVSASDRPLSVGLVAPYLRLYDEFTPTELLTVHSQLRGVRPSNERIASVIERTGLTERANDPIATLSSGMRQRVALAIAIHAAPPLLILDEPSITLDLAGRTILERELRSHIADGGVVILATNDEREKDLCTSFLAL